MKLLEIHKAIRTGSKLRHQLWTTSYIFYNGKKWEVFGTGFAPNFVPLFEKGYDDWELYIEPVTTKRIWNESYPYQLIQRATHVYTGNLRTFIEFSFLCAGAWHNKDGEVLNKCVTALKQFVYHQGGNVLFMEDIKNIGIKSE